ncbi:hypothetical protein ABRP56_09110 [Pectobacterium odoriferum]|uniref:hypothetical protein n=1 Tax=Pectobacterium odoriferum TaxID=78398 RepID=UPI0032EE346D
MLNPVTLESTSTTLAQIKILHEISIQSNHCKRQLIDLMLIDKINEAEENLKKFTSTFSGKELIEKSPHTRKGLGWTCASSDEVMSKFEDRTVIHIDDSEYVNRSTTPAIEKEIDTADIVIVGGRIVKDRISQTEVNLSEDA